MDMDVVKTLSILSCPSDCPFKSCTITLRGPAAILFVSRDTFSDSSAKRFRACFPGVSHKYRAICCKMGYRIDMSVYRAIGGIAAILSQYRAIWGH